MKVKILTSIKEKALEEMVNSFIEDEKVIEIKYTQTISKTGILYSSAMVLYEEGEE